MKCLELNLIILPTAQTCRLSNIHVFGPLKKALGEQQFENDKGVERFMRNWLLTQPVLFYDAAIKNLPSRWEKCISKAENYVEK